MDYEKTAEVSAEQIAHELIAVLPRLNRIISHELNSISGDETTLVQMRVLGQLSEEELTLSALARKRAVSVQAASEHVQGLVDRGWVQRIPDPNDRRQALLRVTDEGLQQLEQVRAQLRELFTPVMAQLDPSETSAIHHALIALRRILIDADAKPITTENIP